MMNAKTSYCLYKVPCEVLGSQGTHMQQTYPVIALHHSQPHASLLSSWAPGCRPAVDPGHAIQQLACQLPKGTGEGWYQRDSWMINDRNLASLTLLATHFCLITNRSRRCSGTYGRLEGTWIVIFSPERWGRRGSVRLVDFPKAVACWWENSDPNLGSLTFNLLAPSVLLFLPSPSSLGSLNHHLNLMFQARLLGFILKGQSWYLSYCMNQKKTPPSAPNASWQNTNWYIYSS